MKRLPISLASAAILACVATGAAAESIPAPRDVPFPGTVQLAVDATDLDHRIFHVRETVLVAASGPLVLLYPKWLPSNHSTTGPVERQITFQPSIKLPAGWEFASAIDGAERPGDTVRFAPVRLGRLGDLPLFADRHYRRHDLDTNPQGPVRLHVFAERPAELEATPEQIEAHRKMVREALALFGSSHFANCDFLLAIGDNLSGIGLEHHQSSENAVGLGYFLDWDGTAAGRDLLPHELEHSWNGKFRRPADLWTPGYEVPMQNSLLWVYEGMTEFWGIVLAARSGLWTREFTRDALAQFAATFDAGRAGRQWRNLQDATNQQIMAYRAPQTYRGWQRGADYYTEGVFLWLDADTKLREATRGKRSLDDFARSFFGVNDGELGPVTYTRDDVVRTLGEIAAADWDGFLGERVQGHGPRAPLDGLERGGWRLVYTDQPSAFSSGVDKASKQASLSSSLGLTAALSDGRITDASWGSPAFAAGLAPGMTMLAVNGRAWSKDVLQEAIVAARGGQGTPDRLGELLKPRT